jgi:DNA-binding XRE family transcriptional regulator
MSSKGLLASTQLRAMREDLGVTQKEASELVGGGPVAFSKYENEDVAQSVAMDRHRCSVARDGGGFACFGAVNQSGELGLSLGDGEHEHIGVELKACWVWGGVGFALRYLSANGAGWFWVASGVLFGTPFDTSG